MHSIQETKPSNNCLCQPWCQCYRVVWWWPRTSWYDCFFDDIEMVSMDWKRSSQDTLDGSRVRNLASWMKSRWRSVVSNSFNIPNRTSAQESEQILLSDFQTYHSTNIHHKNNTVTSNNNNNTNNNNNEGRRKTLISNWGRWSPLSLFRQVHLGVGKSEYNPPVEFYLYPTVSTALVHSVKPKLTE